jgi:diguanylate cyclase (GGDEF)-like protein/PAS domain S-box-containing protein
MAEAQSTGDARDGDARPRDFLQLLKATAEVVSATTDVDGAFQWAVDVVCNYTGWPLGHIFVLDPQTGRLRAHEAWHDADPERNAPFVSATHDLTFAPGEGLPGRILAAGEPTWIIDVRDDRNFPRARAATLAGLGAGLGFPVISSQGVEAVMEFFALEPIELDQELLDLIAHVGLQLGYLLDRSRAEEALRKSEARLAEAESVGRAGSWSWEVGEPTVTWSTELYRIYGVDATPGPVTYEAYMACIHPKDRDRVGALIAGILQNSEPYEHEYRIIRPDGEQRWVHARVAVVTEIDGAPSRLAGHCLDVTERRVAEDARRLAQLELESHQRILERIARGEPVVPTLDALCHDIETRYAGVRCSVLLVDDAEPVLRHIAAPSLPGSFRLAIDGLPIAVGAGACGTAAARNEMVIVTDTLADPLTEAFTELAHQHDLRAVWSQPLTTSVGEVIGTFALYRSEPYEPDADEIRTVLTAGSLAALALERGRTEAALVAAANIDPLTGLANRALFLDQLEAALADADSTVALMFLDLDGFKWVNDSWGHPAGDMVLKEVAERLRSNIGSRGLTARFGGDEFTVLLEEASAADIEATADAVDAVFAEPFVLDDGEFFITCCVGIALNDHATDPYALIRDADAAMFSAKEAGPSSRAVFDERLRDRAVGRLTLDAELRRAIKLDEFVMYYQPIVNLHTGAWIGAEALVRWEHPSRGLVLPDTFIPLAEDDGLIVPLGLLVLDKVAADRASWTSGDGLYATVNVSVVQLADPAIATAMSRALDDNHLSESHLVVEITETGVMKHLDMARTVLENIRGTGVRIVIDDFGVGYSSIARLEQLPIAGIKIDGSFTKTLGVTAKASQMVSAMTVLAHALDLEVVVEGVETAEAHAAAIDARCDAAQGYYFARPMPADQLAQLMGREPPT